MRRVVMSAVVAGSLAACVDTEPEVSSTTSNVDASAFVLPSLSPSDRAQIIHAYDALDPNDVVPRALLEDAMVYFDVNKALIPQQDYFVVVDFSQYSGHDRLWLVDLHSGAVEPHKVAHGDGSDPDNDGYAQLFGNVDGSHMSSLGFYLTGEIYDGTHPHSMRLDGLSADGSPNGMANTNVRSRLIVMHEASYVDDSSSTQQGRSNGCLALDTNIELSVVDRIHDGSLIYAATSSLAPAIGRAQCGDGVCDATESDSCPQDCSSGSNMPPQPPGPTTGAKDGGGCSSTGGQGWLGALVLVGLIRRRRTT